MYTCAEQHVGAKVVFIHQVNLPFKGTGKLVEPLGGRCQVMSRARKHESFAKRGLWIFGQSGVDKRDDLVPIADNQGVQFRIGI